MQPHELWPRHDAPNGTISGFPSESPSRANVTSTSNAITYPVPGTSTTLSITLGIAIPDTSTLRTFLNFAAALVDNHIKYKGRDRPLTADREDPLSVECVVGERMRFTFHVASSGRKTAVSVMTLTWGRVRDTLQGLTDILVAQGRNRLARDVRVNAPEGLEVGRGRISVAIIGASFADERGDRVGLDAKRCFLSGIAPSAVTHISQTF